MCCSVDEPQKYYAPQGTSLVVQWLRLCTPNVGGLGSILGQGVKFTT